MVLFVIVVYQMYWLCFLGQVFQFQVDVYVVGGVGLLVGVQYDVVVDWNFYCCFYVQGLVVCLMCCLIVLKMLLLVVLSILMWIMLLKDMNGVFGLLLCRVLIMCCLVKYEVFLLVFLLVMVFELMMVLVFSGWVLVVCEISWVKLNCMFMFVFGVLNYWLLMWVSSGRCILLFCYVVFSLLGVMNIGDSVECGLDCRKLKFLVNLFGIRLCSEILLIRLISWMWLVVCFGVVVIGILLVIIMIFVFRLMLQFLLIILIVLCGLQKLVLVVWYISGLVQKFFGIFVLWVWCMCLICGRQVLLLMNLQVCGIGVVSVCGLRLNMLLVLLVLSDLYRVFRCGVMWFQFFRVCCRVVVMLVVCMLWCRLCEMMIRVLLWLFFFKELSFMGGCLELWVNKF